MFAFFNPKYSVLLSYLNVKKVVAYLVCKKKLVVIVRIISEKLSVIDQLLDYKSKGRVLYCKRRISRDLQVARPCRSRCPSLVSVASLAWCWGEPAVPYILRWYWNHVAVVFSFVATSTMIRGPTNTSCSLISGENIVNFRPQSQLQEVRVRQPEWMP